MPIKKDAIKSIIQRKRCLLYRTCRKFCRRMRSVHMLHGTNSIQRCVTQPPPYQQWFPSLLSFFFIAFFFLFFFFWCPSLVCNRSPLKQITAVSTCLAILMEWTWRHCGSLGPHAAFTLFRDISSRLRKDLAVMSPPSRTLALHQCFPFSLNCLYSKLGI